MLAATLVVGAAVQGLVGLGLGLVAAPVTTLLAPALMPDLLLWLAMLFPAATLAREHQDVDWHGLGWSMPARVVGTAAGAWLLALVSVRSLGIGVSLMVLVSVALTVRAVRVPVTPSTLTAAGFVSGVTGTATSIGGPPMAILLQHRPPRQLRTTLAVYFLVGAALSLAGLALTGQLETAPLVLAVLLAPALLVGLGIAHVLHGRLPDHRVRVAVLTVCGSSAVVLLLRSLAG